MEVVVKQARTTKHPWLVACDAMKDPQEFSKGFVVQRKVHVHKSARSESLHLSVHRPKRRAYGKHILLGHC